MSPYPPPVTRRVPVGTHMSINRTNSSNNRITIIVLYTLFSVASFYYLSFSSALVTSLFGIMVIKAISYNQPKLNNHFYMPQPQYRN